MYLLELILKDFNQKSKNLFPKNKNDFNIFKEINKIHRHIKKSSRQYLIDRISKRLLELEFKLNQLIKSKCLKWIVRKILPTL